MWQLFRRSPFRMLVTLSFTAALPALAHAGTITGLTVTPAQAQAGTSVNATATGSGLCGAVHIDWGDGTAITYATAKLPVTQAHVYQSAGAFKVRAQGMANCDGEATAPVTITPAPAPPAPAPRLSGIGLMPPGAAPKAPVTIALQGTGSCRIVVDFGDGNSQELAGPLPLSVRHTYALAGRYAIVATPATACGDRQTATLVVGNNPTAPRLVGIQLAEVQGSAGLRTITVTGDGPCAYTLDYGDGNTEARNGALPDVVRHNYAAAGRYTIITTAAPPCTGVLRSTFIIKGQSGAVIPPRESGGVVSRVEVQPRVASPGQDLTVSVGGSGSCRFTVDFGDRQVREMQAALPHQFTYRYAQRGDYQIVVRTAPPCTGDANTALRVRRR
jgi:hypothetical protein